MAIVFWLAARATTAYRWPADSARFRLLRLASIRFNQAEALDDVLLEKSLLPNTRWQRSIVIGRRRRCGSMTGAMVS
jgi:hypothetical protein